MKLNHTFSPWCGLGFFGYVAVVLLLIDAWNIANVATSLPLFCLMLNGMRCPAYLQVLCRDTNERTALLAIASLFGVAIFGVLILVSALASGVKGVM